MSLKCYLLVTIASPPPKQKMTLVSVKNWSVFVFDLVWNKRTGRLRSRIQQGASSHFLVVTKWEILTMRGIATRIR